jgi:hypothetical protein
MRNTHYVFNIDISGSMYGSLDKLRTDLKNHIGSVLKSGDVFSLVYFSGRNQAGVILKEFKLESLEALQDAQNAIDRWLKPMGLTGFELPLVHSSELVNTNYNNVLLFMTDGYNNDSPATSVLSLAEEVGAKFDSTVFVEYGYYCDSAFLAKLASKSGGVVVSADTFAKLSYTFQNVLVNDYAPKTRIFIDRKDQKYVFLIQENRDVITMEIPENGELMAPVNTTYAAFNDATETEEILGAIIGNLQMGKANQVEQLLIRLNNNELYKIWENTYGKQAINNFKDVIKSYMAFPDMVSRDGIESNGSAYSVYDLLTDLSQMNAKVLIDQENYSSVSRGKDTDLLSPDQEAHLATLKGKKAIAEYMESIKPLTFVRDLEDTATGLEKLVFNSSRANVSILMKYDGHVVLPENKWGLKEYRTHIFRNYTIIKDGILNVTELTLLRTPEVESLLSCFAVPYRANGTYVVISLDAMPLITRALIQSITADSLAKKAFELERLKAVQKVLNGFNKVENPKTTVEDVELNEYLKEKGITYNGFAPASRQAESTDVYMAPDLDIKIKGLSTLPSVAAVEAKLVNGKSLTLSENMINSGLKIVESIKVVQNYPELLKTITYTNLKDKRSLELEIAKMVGGLILSKGWFSDKADFEDNTHSFVDPTFGELSVTFDYKDVAIKI